MHVCDAYVLKRVGKKKRICFSFPSLITLSPWSSAGYKKSNAYLPWVLCCPTWGFSLSLMFHLNSSVGTSSFKFFSLLESSECTIFLKYHLLSSNRIPVFPSNLQNSSHPLRRIFPLRFSPVQQKRGLSAGLKV